MPPNPKADLGNTSGARRFMFFGAQISLYLKTGDLAGVTMHTLGAIDHYRDRLLIEVDCVATLFGMQP
jgi:hypothetical protein